MLFLFSFWIITWVFVFLIGFVPYSPKFILIVAFGFALYEISLLASKKYLLYNSLNIGTKLLAFILVINTSIDIIPSIVYTSIYILYLYANNKTVTDIYGSDAIIERAKKSILLL